MRGDAGAAHHEDRARPPPRRAENAIRRLLDLDLRSHIDQVNRALAALGKRLEVRVLEPASCYRKAAHRDALTTGGDGADLKCL